MEPTQPNQPTQSAPPPPSAPPIQNPLNTGSMASPFRHDTLKKIIITFGALFLLIVIVVVGAMAVTVYTKTKLPILSSHRKELTLLFYKIPLIPKNPEQILITAVDKNTRLKTYTPDFSLTAQLKTADVELGSIDLQVKGPVDITDEKSIAFSIDGKAAVNFGGHSYEVDGKIIEKNKAIYAKLDKLPAEVMNLGTYMGVAPQTLTPQEEIKQNFEELFKNWIKYEFKSLPTKAREELEKNIESTSITNKIREESENFLLKSSILPEVKKLKDEKIDGVDTYHLLLNPSREKVKQIILEYINQHKDLQKKEYREATDALSSSFEQLHLEVWVGKDDAIVRKTSLQTQMDLGFLQKMMYPSYSPPIRTISAPARTVQYAPTPDYFGLGDLGKAKLAFSTVVVLTNVNKPVTITPPTKTVTVEEYMKLFQDSFLTKAAREQKAKQALQTQDMNEISKALTMYYVENNRYPASLTELLGKYIQQGSPVTQRLGTYSYRRGNNPNKYVVYTPITGKYDSSYSTPYFGFTSGYNYPHQLTTYDFTEINQ